MLFLLNIKLIVQNFYLAGSLCPTNLYVGSSFALQIPPRQTGGKAGDDVFVCECGWKMFSSNGIIIIFSQDNCYSLNFNEPDVESNEILRDGE